jgi:hypothetical protein
LFKLTNCIAILLYEFVPQRLLFFLYTLPNYVQLRKHKQNQLFQSAKLRRQFWVKAVKKEQKRKDKKERNEEGK